ncbi:MAG TPA: hypothetical protein ENK10_00195 [Acidobacteria bacterium]|nr:hypothetical protein [Acidobacteriota bacterium]
MASNPSHDSAILSVGSAVRRHRKIPWRLLALCLLPLVSPLALRAETDGPSLLPPVGSVRHRREAIRIEIPNLAALDPERLIFELDAFDVSDLASFDRQESVVSLTPVEALAWGEHRIRFFERSPEGELVERGAWDFEVRHSRALRQAEAGTEASVSAFRRIAAAGVEDPGRRGGSDGGARLSATIAEDDWRLSMEAEMVHASDSLQLPRERGTVDLGDFLLRGEKGKWWLVAGHHSPAPPSLVAQDLRRRGLSGGYGGPEQRLYAALFSLRAQEVAGLTGGFGTGDPGNRVDGVTVSVRPIPARPDGLVVSATWLDGRTPGEIGFGVGGDSVSHAVGRAAGYRLQGSFFDDRLEIDTELARTRHDVDGDGSAAARSDDAFAARLHYTALDGGTISGRPAMLRFGFERSRVGTFFRSIADPTGIADQDLLRADGSLSWAGWEIEAGVSRQTDNVNALALLPRIRTVLGTVSVGWMPTQAEDAETALPWYGQPSFSLQWADLSQDVVREGGEISVGDFRDTDSLALSATFSYPQWSWSAAHSVGREIDRVGLGADTDNRITEFGLQVAGDGRPSIGLSVQRSQTRDLDAGTAAVTDAVALDLGHAFTGGLRGSLGVSWNRSWLSGGTSARRTLDLTGMLRWTIREEGGGRPGVLLSLEGQRHRRRDPLDPLVFAQGYRVFLRLAVNWSSGR